MTSTVPTPAERQATLDRIEAERVRLAEASATWTSTVAAYALDERAANDAEAVVTYLQSRQAEAEAIRDVAMAEMFVGLLIDARAVLDRKRVALSNRYDEIEVAKGNLQDARIAFTKAGL